MLPERPRENSAQPNGQVGLHGERSSAITSGRLTLDEVSHLQGGAMRRILVARAKVRAWEGYR
jgi:hypothetical protein